MINENNFFREASIRICGNLEIDKALRECLLYVRDYIPAKFMAFAIYLPEESAMETIATAHQHASTALPVKFPVSDAQIKRLKIKFTKPRITITNNKQMLNIPPDTLKDLGWPTGPNIVIEMVLAGKRMGALIISGDKKTVYTEDHSRLLSLLNEPLGIALTNSIRYRKVQELKNLLADDNRYLQNELLKTTEQKIDTFLSNSFGFGGTNSTLVVKNLSH